MIRDILLATANAIHMCKEGDSRSHWSRRLVYHFPLVAAACDCCQRWRTLFLGLLVGSTISSLLLAEHIGFGWFVWLGIAWGFFLGSAFFNWQQLSFYVTNRKTYLVASRLAEPTAKEN